MIIGQKGRTGYATLFPFRYSLAACRRAIKNCAFALLDCQIQRFTTQFCPIPAWIWQSRPAVEAFFLLSDELLGSQELLDPYCSWHNNTHGHKLRSPTFKKAQFVTGLGIRAGAVVLTSSERK